MIDLLTIITRTHTLTHTHTHTHTHTRTPLSHCLTLARFLFFSLSFAHFLFLSLSFARFLFLSFSFARFLFFPLSFARFLFLFSLFRSVVCYGMATMRRLLKIIGLFYKRALWKRLYSSKETYKFKESTNWCHPIWRNDYNACYWIHVFTTR